MHVYSYGTGKDQEVWSLILKSAGDDLAHRLWCAVIREVATVALAPALLDDPDELGPDDLVSEWQNEALPSGANLTLILGELDYFRDTDLSWDERMALAGTACGSPSDVVWDLKDRLFGSPDAQDAVTEESVEDFFCEWRTRFFLETLRVVEGLKADGDNTRHSS
ncbi:MAG: hypothetical protein HONDAALG_03357 [Gammaproteobacteria bacterium]|nr:hypothetical protein [Gammaproteobacteria bacterium]